MIVVYCINSLHLPGGMERVLSTKVNWLAQQRGYTIHIAMRNESQSPFFPLDSRVICHNLHAKSNKEHRKLLDALLTEVKPTITITMCGPELAFLYKINDGSKKIAEFHFTKYYLTYLVNGIEKLPLRPLHLLKAWYYQKREERFASKYENVVLLTKQDLNIWKNPSNMCYIHNPISFRSDIVSSLENKQIMAVGRFIAQKGFLLLLDAFSMISSKFYDWKLLIYGEGQDYNRLKDKIKKYHLEDQVSLLPPSQNIKKCFLNSSIFVFPSIYEGFGLVLTEAMECGLPCVAFDCECGPREIINDGENGFLVRNKNVSELAEKMSILISDERLRKFMGKNAKKCVSKFYPENIMPKWIDLFQKVAK